MKKIWICSLRGKKKPTQKQTTANVGFSKKKYHLSKWLKIVLYFVLFSVSSPCYHQLCFRIWLNWICGFFKSSSSEIVFGLSFTWNEFLIPTCSVFQTEGRSVHCYIPEEFTTHLFISIYHHFSFKIFSFKKKIKKGTQIYCLSIWLPLSNCLTNSTHQDAALSSCYVSVYLMRCLEATGAHVPPQQPVLLQEEEAHETFTQRRWMKIRRKSSEMTGLFWAFSQSRYHQTVRCYLKC